MEKAVFYLNKRILILFKIRAGSFFTVLACKYIHVLILQDTAPLGLIPLIDLGLERKRKV